MHAVRQSLRPKHQVLVLKCYPRFQKNVVEVKPKSSELSYLLYYVKTRRSKVQKVGEFLEKKAESDVSRGKTGNVQVTLEILRAWIKESPHDLPLYSPYILRILKLILSSRDLGMVEDTILTWQAFCEHHDMATLAADQSHLRRYEDVVQSYTHLAGSPPPQLKSPLSTPMMIRWKTVGVQAIRCITSSDTLGAGGGKHLNIIMPMLLSNLYSDQGDYLLALQRRAEASDQSEKDLALKRRTSFATVRTFESVPDTNLAVLSGTAADADRIAQEELGVAAFQSLKQIFVANNRAQIRTATTAMLKFISSKASSRRPNSGDIATDWAIILLETVTTWTPVQDRFVILVTTMETLVRSPVTEGNLPQQLLLVTLVDKLLSSTINMIGLSIMDVLLGLIQHVLLLLQLGGKGSNVLPHHQQTDAIDLFRDNKDILDQPSPTDTRDHDALDDASSPSATRQNLLRGLQRCIGDLATHIYYSDQISDMITAILNRLKPSAMSGIPTTAAAIEDPVAAARAISNSVNLQEDPNTHDFFSFGTARVTALHAIKDVLTVANKKQSVAGAGAVGRNRVSAQIWEGTQWLLCDEDRRVRRAYVDALLAWLKLEMSKDDLRVMEDKRHLSKTKTNANGENGRNSSMTQRATSSASQNAKSRKSSNSSFLQLLHLAIYDNALESPESESDILLLHLLLYNLVEKLGVNAVKSGLPMILRIQEDINNDGLVSSARAKINIGSLVHGYLLTLSGKFDLDATQVGYGIHTEVTRRRKHGLWLDAIRAPPMTPDQTTSGNYTSLVEDKPLEVVLKESLKPFDASPALVEQIAQSYATSMASPPTSPPSSPGRVFSMPILSSSGPTSSTGHELPSAFKNAMLSTWSKDQCIAAVEKDVAASASLHGSRSGNQSARNGFLIANDHSPRAGSPTGIQYPTQLTLGKQRNQDGDVRRGRLDRVSLLPLHQEQLRRSSGQDSGPPTPISSSDRHVTLRVDDLKRVLAGGALAEAFSHRNNGPMVRTASPLRASSTAYQDFAEKHVTRPVTDGAGDGLSDGSESVVDAEGFESASDGDTTHPLPPLQSPRGESSALAHEYSQQLGPRSFDHSPSPGRGNSRPNSKDFIKGRPRSSSSASGEDPEANARALKGELVPPLSRGSGTSAEEEVPPVPPLPSNYSDLGSPGLVSPGFINKMNAAARVSNGGAPRPTTAPTPTRSAIARESSYSDMSSVGRSSLRMSGYHDKKSSMQQLLSGIEVGDVSASKGVSRPPY
ncbi:plasma membrane localization protein [Lambiella insularis]|nr:plasma membrane localization protein [Lambiella insularis]